MGNVGVMPVFSAAGAGMVVGVGMGQALSYTAYNAEVVTIKKACRISGIVAGAAAGSLSYSVGHERGFKEGHRNGYTAGVADGEGECPAY